MVLSLSACGNKETKKSDSDSSKKKFTVGFDAEYPPYGYMDSDTGEYTGFDLELAKEVAELWDWNIRHSPLPGIPRTWSWRQAISTVSGTDLP